jgi:signal transduction histidine kinase
MAGVRDLLRSVWDEPRPSEPPPAGPRDWALVGVLMALALFEGVLRPDLPHRVVSVVVTVALMPVLLVRRTRPLLAVVVAFGTSAAVQLLVTSGEPLDNFALVGVLLIPFALARWGSGREVVIGTAVLVVAASLSLLVSNPTVSDIVGGVAILLTTLALGAAARFRARSRTRELEQVRMREREDLARDLHDVVAHHVSAMAVRAQAGIATAATRPEAAVDALHVIEAEATRALAEMRSMVRVLRTEESAALAPTPSLDDVAALADESASPRVDVRVTGDAAGVPPAVAAAVYRLAQEAVTNARRHARHPSRVDVSVAVDDGEVRLDVTDDGETQGARSGGGPAYGLVGMGERAALLGGTCTAGPRAEGGWAVRAVLPLSGAGA